MPEVGQTIAGKYRVVRTIGAGGMGTVVSATHVQLGTPVALKFLSERIKDSASSVERFTREARACAQLKSEHVCRVTDFGVEDGRPYIAMELLDGVDLARLIDSGRVEVGVAVDFVMQACAGLVEAHALGIVHRDLKPGNLFLTRRPDGTPLVKVLDFGVAKIPHEDEPSLTKTSHVVGSPGYMAPEQLRSSKSVDRRADVWALGVILYELISARHPFYAEATTEIALKIAMDEPPPLEEAPEGLRQVVMCCLAKDPEARFAEVGALAAALAPFAHHDRVAAAAAIRLVIDAAVQRRAAPESTTVVSRDEGTAATKRETPRKLAATSHEAGVGALIAKPTTTRKRFVRSAGWFLGGLIVAGIAGAVVVSAMWSDDPPAEAEPVALPSPADAAASAPDAAIADAEERFATLEIKISGASSATIIVDGVVWGEGKRIQAKTALGRREIRARVPGRPDVILSHEVKGDTSVTLAIPQAKPRSFTELFGIKPPGKSTPKPPTAGAGSSAGSGSGSSSTAGSGSSATAGAGSSAGAGSGSSSAAGAGSGTGDPAAANAMLRKMRDTLVARGLASADLGNVGVNLFNELSRAQRTKNWTAVAEVATKIEAVARDLKIDRAFISSKSARVTARLGQSSASEAVRDQIVELQASAKATAERGDFTEANAILNRTLSLIPLRPPPPLVTPRPEHTR